MIKNNIERLSWDNYILNENNMNHYLKYKIKTVSINTTNAHPSALQKKAIPSSEKTSDSVFIPTEYDTLFWCFYIMLNGESAYEILHVKNVLIEKQIKITYIETIRANKETVKKHKFATLTNIENNLANDKNVNMETIATLCSIHKMNLIFVNKKTYFELVVDEAKPIYIIYELAIKSKCDRFYGLKTGDAITIENIRNTLYKMDTLDKPIKALSSYNLPKLIEIAVKLAIELVDKVSGKNKPKNKLYDEINLHFKLLKN